MTLKEIHYAVRSRIGVGGISKDFEIDLTSFIGRGTMTSESID